MYATKLDKSYDEQIGVGNCAVRSPIAQTETILNVFAGSDYALSLA